MKNSVLLPAFLVAALAGTGLRIGRADDGKAVVLLSVGGTDTGLVLRVEHFVSAHLMCPARSSISGEAVKESSNAVLRAATQVLRPSDVCLVALVDARDAGLPYRAVVSTNRVAFLNIARLRPTGEGHGEATERFARRCEKETMRAIGELIGLESCLHMACAMFSASSEAEMDAKGRAFCPPCQTKAENLLRKAGVRLTVDEEGQ